jgi:NADPH2:quinone reductase
MRAIRIHKTGGPEVLQMEELPDPTPGAGELLIKVEAVGLNFIEIYYRLGQYPSTLPYTPGSECAGTVVAVGSGVTGFNPGDRVVTQNAKGSYATRALVPADKAVHIPDGVSTNVAAASWLQGLTAHYLTHSTFKLERGQRCLVLAAAGGVGLLLVQMAKRLGAHVIGAASTPEKRELAKNAGADEVFDYHWPELKVDVVYDSVGAHTFERSLKSLKPRGMMVLFGQSSGPVHPIDPQILNRYGSLYLTRPTLNAYVAAREELEWRAKDLLGWIAAGELDVRIGAGFPLSEAAKAQTALTERKTTGKTLLIP